MISKEDSFHNGTITYQLVIKAYDTAYIDSIKIFYSFFDDYNHNGTFPLFLDSADSLVINITLDYDSTNLPYYFRQVKNLIYSHKDSIHSSVDLVLCNIYFTPYGSTEVWNLEDFYSLYRQWNLPDSIEPTRIFISKDSIPISNIMPLDSIHEEWEEDNQYITIPGLPYKIEMAAIHPDSLKMLVMTYEEYQDEYNDSLSITILRRYEGTIWGRINCPDYINDNGIQQQIPLGGIRVKLMTSGRVIKQGFTNDNGEYSLPYDVVKWAGDDEGIRITLQIETEDKFGSKVKKRWDGFGDNPYSLSFRRDPIEDNSITEWNINLTGTESHAFRIASFIYMAYRFFEDNASGYKPDWNLKVKLHYAGVSGSHYRTASRNIFLESGDEQHETVIWHEFGHYVMHYLSGTENKGYGTHSSLTESNFELAWSEGWATGFMSMLDVYYRQYDDEFGNYSFFEGGFFPGTNTRAGASYPIELRDPDRLVGTNGIRSEYHTACAVSDLFDGPSYFNNSTDYNDARRTVTVNGAPNLRGYELGVFDELQISASNIFKALQNGALSVTDFYSELLTIFTDDCKTKKLIKIIFAQNRVSLNNPNIAIPSNSFTSDLIGFLETLNDIRDRAVAGTKNIETDMSLDIGELSIIGSNDLSFNYTTTSINATRHLSDNLDINNGAFLSINRNIEYGFAGGVGFTPPANSQLSMEICADNVNVFDNGFIEIGDRNRTNNSETKLSSGSILTIAASGNNAQSRLIINDNSKFVIEEGAVLRYFNGAEIILNGPNAVLEIRGEIQLMNGAIFEVQGGNEGLGYVKFFKNYNPNTPNLINSPTNNGNVKLTGIGSTVKLVEIDGNDGLYVGGDILNFEITYAKILLGDKSGLKPEVKNYVNFEWVRVSQLYNGYKHSGIYIAGYAVNRFKSVVIEGGYRAFTNNSIGSFHPLNLINTRISNCDIGVRSFSSGLNYTVGTVKGYSVAGWQSFGHTIPGLISGVTFENDQNNTNTYGVQVFSNIGLFGAVTFNYSRFIKNSAGAWLDNLTFNLDKCNYFTQNHIGV